MKVIGAGLPRTGTAALRDALVRLGFGPCYHTSEILDRLDHVGPWLAAYEGEPVPYELFAGYQATADAPSCFFWRALIDEYPQAKVILTVRDARSWYQSMLTTLLRRDRFGPSPDPVLAALRELALATFTHVYGPDNDEDRLTALFHRHNAEVRATVPADRLLIYEVADGWAPLCAFLGVPVPEEPFPWRNSSAEWASRVDRRRAVGARQAESAGERP